MNECLVWTSTANFVCERATAEGKNENKKGKKNGFVFVGGQCLLEGNDTIVSIHNHTSQHSFPWLDTMHPPKPPRPQWDFQTVPLGRGVKPQAGAAAIRDVRLIVANVSEPYIKLKNLASFPSFSLYSLRHNFFPVCLCYITEVDTWSFLACLDSFACSFLVCILQHREAELSMPQNGTAQHETSSAPNCRSQPIFSDVSVLLRLWSFSGLGRKKTNWLL